MMEGNTTTRKAILTLPLTPKANPPFFFYLTPFIADVWGKIERKPVFILVGLRGMKYSPLAVSQFQQHIQRLNIKGEVFYDTEYSLSQLQNDCTYLIKKEVLGFDYDEVLICPCGRVECLSKALCRKEFRVIDNSSYPPKCKVCQGILQRVRTKTLKWHLKECSIPECVWYNQAFTEIKTKAKETSYRSYLVSRLRPSCPEIILDKETVKIDVDFAWLLFMINLVKHLGITITYIPVTFSVYRQLLLFCSLIKEFDSEIKVKFYSVPKIFFKTPTFKEGSLWRFNSLTLRLILAHGLARTKKEIFLESNIVHWADITTRYIHPSKKQPSDVFRNLKEFCLALQRYPLPKVFKKLRSSSADSLALQIMATIS